MFISVIIPVLNEEKSIAATLEALLALAPHEVILVDGGSTDGTRTIAEEYGVKITASERGRARQMNCGAREASGDVLLFLHADTRLPTSAFDDITAALADSLCIGGRFDVELDGDHWMLPIVARMISYRSRVTKVSTGDQALFVRRQVFERIGGFPDIPLMEDIAFCRKLKKFGAVACSLSRVVTSARRWEVNGVWRTIFRMWILKLLYLAGVSPARLKQFYADTR
ncbi:MAG TPA: TIGR04283 family arsenosugar biosynthesis glycosyltransferase [Acidobacteriota bacterium]|nr:TIGR04283 family arsenosugar biosynthesis glycosyltransferase [Acidobacteriota bacterium]